MELRVFSSRRTKLATASKYFSQLMLSRNKRHKCQHDTQYISLHDVCVCVCDSRLL